MIFPQIVNIQFVLAIQMFVELDLILRWVDIFFQIYLSDLSAKDYNFSWFKLKFQSFTIAPPHPGSLTGDPNDGLHGGAIGDCVTDTFQISGSQYSSPQICGINTGQHGKIMVKHKE